MGSSNVPPDAGSPSRTELLQVGVRSRVVRLCQGQHTVIRKEPLGPDAQRRLRHEREMLERLRDVPGIVQLLDSPRHPSSIVLADVGGPSLAEQAKPLGVDALISLAVDLARAVAAMHRRGVMHGDITPANVLLTPDGAPVLVDFALATTFAEIRPEFGPVAPGSEITGTLAYLAPEQTGRTGRSVDQRSDLYALGATLYELATGAPPFGSDDPLRLTHDHLARVPVPPAQLNPQVPEPLSDIIGRLLEKEPENRYQTADGLAHDLEQVRDARAGSPAGPFRIGERDVPLRLLPPSRLVGRESETAALQAAFEDALAGGCRAVLVGGAPGVGKTALVDELRPVVTRSGGWFVAGKFDQYQRDLGSSGVYQAFRTLGRLLLAEPEDELVAVRERILAGLGPNAGLMAAVVPEFATLLGVPPDPGDPLTAQVRGQRNGVQILRAIASRERPVLMFFDDVQWAGRTPLGFIEILLDEEPIEGLLLVCAHREPEVGGTDPFATHLPRWRERAGVRQVPLGDLPVPSLVTMVADMLRVSPEKAADLAGQLHLRTSGNPYVTVELLGALRRDGLLSPTPIGWQWDTATVRTRLNRTEVGELLIARVAATPPATRRVMDVMACLGGRVEVSVLQAASGEPAEVLQQTLAPALAEGVLVVAPGDREAVRFRHDRIREAILREIAPAHRHDLQLAMARRLATHPDLFAIAAEQYLPVTRTPEVLDGPAERRRIVELLRRAAEQARFVADHVVMDALLAGALQLVDPADTATRVELHHGRLTALYSLGRLEEGDEQYQAIEDLRPDAVQHATAAAVQVRTLTHRGRLTEAIDVAIDLLRELGIPVPAERSPDEVAHQMRHLHRWLDESDLADDLSRPEISDPRLLAALELIRAVLPAIYFVPDLPLYTWLTLEAPRILLEHGPARSLIAAARIAANASTMMQGEDKDVAYRATRRILALGEARGYEPETSVLRALYASVVVCWFEPVENAVRVARQARTGLIAGGDLAYAGYAYHPAVTGLLECARTLDDFVDEVEEALAFSRRTGNETTSQWFGSYRWVAAALRGEGTEATAVAEMSTRPLRYADNPASMLFEHIARAMVAAVFGDASGLVHHAAAAMPLLSAAAGLYPAAVARLLRGMALAEQARAADTAQRPALLAELDELSGWLAARAADAPDNFLHLLRLLEAERAWAVGDFRVAAQAFDAARREVAERRRPWHRALITERAARFHLAHGLDLAGRDLLTEARHHYGAWGATAKVAQLDWAYPALLPGARATGADQHSTGTQPPSAVTTGTIDLFGILSASHALSSETSIERLHARVVEVLSAMTGATGVHLLLLDDDRRDWLVPRPDHTTGTPAPGGRVDEDDAPMSVLRYVQRTGETLIVDDATRDDRFARDSYFADLDSCSVLAMPIVSRGAPRAVLLLENRLIRAAFTAQRLDAVRLIAAQLAVSLDNAQLYAHLTASRARIVAAADQARRRIERDLHDGAQQRLVTLAMRARTVQATVPAASGALKEELDALVTEATTAITELRELARGIHPPTLAKGGLRSAVNALARRSVVPVKVEVPADRRLPEPIETAAYYIVTETLTNATKHARASLVTVTVETDTGPAGAVVRITVHDDGRGGARFADGSGLLGLKDRVETLSGRLVVRSAPGTGTTVQAELPLQQADAIPG
jgi:signal transduction histidine kinase